MTQQWPDDPGPQPPLPPAGSPPVAGAPQAPASPTGSSWPAAGDVTPPPPPTGPTGGSRSRTLLVVGLVVLVALVSSALTLWLTGGGDDDVEAAGSPSSSTTATTEATDPPDPSTPGPSTDPTIDDPVDPVTEEELLAEVAELSDFVEQARGHEFVEPVEVELLDDAAFEQRLFDIMDEEADAVELQSKLLTALGLVEPGVDLLEAQESLLSQGVLGFYETEMNELVVRGTALTPYTRQTIVHELVHALDDQLFELYRPEYDERDDEIGQGFSAVIEGNARRVEDDWVDTLTDDERAERNREEALYGLQADLSGIPPVLISLLVFPYEDGLLLVDDLVDLDGEDGVDAALEEPPTTTEQVLVPGAFLAGEGGADIATPPADGEVIDEGVLGMLILKVMLEESVPGTQALRAADGWSGDRYVAWDVDDVTCIRVDVEMDTDDDALELVQALEAYTFDHDNVSFAEQGSTGVRIDGCTPPPDGGGGGSRL